MGLWPVKGRQLQEKLGQAPASTVTESSCPWCLLPLPPASHFPRHALPARLFGTRRPSTPLLLSRRSSSLRVCLAPWGCSRGQERWAAPEQLPQRDAFPSLPCFPRLLSPHLRGPAPPGHRQRPRLPAAAGGRGQEPPALPRGGGHGDEVPGPEAEEIGNGHQLHPGTRRGLPRGAAVPSASGQELLEPAEGMVPKTGWDGAVGVGGLHSAVNGIFRDLFLLTELVVSQAGPVPVCPQGKGDAPSPLRDGL